MNHTQEQTTADRGSEKAAKSASKPPTRIFVAALVILGSAIGIWYYLQQRLYEATDNAFIEGNVVQISPRISGQVLHVQVNDNQHVNCGDLLVELDPSDYAAKLSEAKARLGNCDRTTLGRRIEPEPDFDRDGGRSGSNRRRARCQPGAGGSTQVPVAAGSG
jgi:membrane fusion protein (multidrug efflux system)